MKMPFMEGLAGLVHCLQGEDSKGKRTLKIEMHNVQWVLGGTLALGLLK